MSRAKEVLLLLFVCQVVTAKGSDVENLFAKLNDEMMGINHQTAQLAWDTNFDPINTPKSLELQQFAVQKLKWNLMRCNELKKYGMKFNQSQRRFYNIFCRGPKYSGEQEKRLIALSDGIERIYTSTRLCIPESLNFCRNPEFLFNSTFIHFDQEVNQLVFHPTSNSIKIVPKSPVVVAPLKCFTGEPELENLMSNDFTRCDSNGDLIKYWIWESWRAAVGPGIRELYPKLVEVMNEGAKNDGFDNIGEAWKMEMELGDVDELMQRLMSEVQPIYDLIHEFLRTILKKLGKIMSEKYLPAHILGWNANWFNLFKNHVAPEIFKASTWNMDDALKQADLDPISLMKRIENFYTSTGLPRMTNEFWENSLLENSGNKSCHGTSADMFAKDDFRMIVCGFKNFYDFYVIVHEMGHIEQYMLNRNEPPVFRPGNTVVQETIGDAIFLAMMVPMHLNRLRLIDDEQLFPTARNDFDLLHLMMMAFTKLPEIPSGFVLEKFRYDLFARRVGDAELNDYFWDLTRKYQRVEPPNPSINRHDLFDAAAKFHFAANVPYARYFFANILQYQVFRGLCEKTIYGKLSKNQTLPLPLHKCDIYGSKRAGNLLKKALQPGSSISFKTILKTLTGSDKISTAALKEYYQPLTDWIKKYLKSDNNNNY